LIQVKEIMILVMYIRDRKGEKK